MILLKRRFDMLNIKNKLIEVENKRPIIYDLIYDNSKINSPVIIFCHGYKGFKDWGCWPIMAESFASRGFAFLKFNFSFNGGTVNNPIDFPDLKAFSENNYSKELSDINEVIDWVTNEYENNKALDIENLILMGHSRGGGIATIFASEDNRIKKLITLAGVSDYESRFPKEEAFCEWKSRGVYYVKNSRTNQYMPHKFQFYKDFIENKKRLTISKSAKRLKIPHLIVHGDNDSSVDFSEALCLNSWSPKGVLCRIKGANHVFGAKHPWEGTIMPVDLDSVCAKTIDFINN